MRHYPDRVIMTETASASLGFFCVSATRYRGAENVAVVPVVVAPFKFSNVKRQIFAAYLVIAAHDAAFQERPEPIDSLSMNRAIYVLPRTMPDNAMLFQVAISGMIVSRDQADFFGN